MELCLDNAELNTAYKVLEVTGVDKMAIRLKELGFVAGTVVKITNKSALKNCSLVCLRGGNIALRDNALTKIMVKKI